MPRELNIQAARNGAADDGATFPTSEPQGPQESSEPRSAMTKEYISATENVDYKVGALKEKYVKKCEGLVQNVPSPLNLFCMR